LDDRDAPDELTWHRAKRGLDRLPAPWRPSKRSPRPAWLVLAAAVLGAVGLIYWPSRDAPAPDRAAATRGAPVQLVEPVGEVGELGVFRWQAPPLALTYRVDLRRGDTTLWSGISSGQELEAPPDLVGELVPGVSYHWRVEGVAEAGRVVVSSEWVEVRLQPTGD
jgi:hypothetical protein